MTLINREDQQKYKFAVIASDVVIFTIFKGELKVLLIRMKKEPFTNQWACPGGLVKAKESVDFAAQRLLFEKTAVKDVYLEQLQTFGEIDRDPFGRVVSVAYFALIPPEGVNLRTSSEYSDVSWFSIKDLPTLAYDHQEIIKVAVERLQSKIEYSNIVYGFLGREFTLGELQEIYEIILNKKIDKRNFRRKLLSLSLVAKSGKKRRGQANRPASLYHFVNRKLQEVKIL